MAFENIRERRNGPLQTNESDQAGVIRRVRNIAGGRSLSGVESDVQDDNLKAIWQDPTKREIYRNIGVATEGPQFAALFAKMQENARAGNKMPITDEERGIRERVRQQYVYRQTLAQECGKLMTPDMFDGLRSGPAHNPATRGLSRIVGELGSERALSLMRPRIARLAGEVEGDHLLMHLLRSLRQMHNIYNTSSYRKMAARIERARDTYSLRPSEYAEFSRGGNWHEIAQRVKNDLARDQSFLNRTRYWFSNWWTGIKVGYVGWREDHARATQQLRVVRGQILGILSRTVDNSFFEAVDREIDAGSSVENQEQERRQQEQVLAQQVSADALAQRVKVGWEQHRGTHTFTTADGKVHNLTEPALSAAVRDAAFQQYRDTIFTQQEYARMQSQSSQFGVLGAILRALFDMRIRNINAPVTA